MKNGVLIIDDYGHWEGAKAVDDYLDKNQIKIFLSRIDYSGRLGIKNKYLLISSNCLHSMLICYLIFCFK